MGPFLMAVPGRIPKVEKVDDSSKMPSLTDAVADLIATAGGTPLSLP